jgi:hypothetical protein
MNQGVVEQVLIQKTACKKSRVSVPLRAKGRVLYLVLYCRYWVNSSEFLNKLPRSRLTGK